MENELTLASSLAFRFRQISMSLLVKFFSPKSGELSSEYPLTVSQPYPRSVPAKRPRRDLDAC